MSVSPIDEWIAKAEEDYGAALDLWHLRKPLRANAVCFHCQQCAEKYLKAFLVRHRVEFAKSHDLDELRIQCVKIDSTFELLRSAADILQPFAVAIRYPGLSATETDVQVGLGAVKQVREFVRARLGLK